MSTLTVASVILVVVGLALAVAGKAISVRRGERPTGPRLASIVVGCLFVGAAVALLLFTVAVRD